MFDLKSKLVYKSNRILDILDTLSGSSRPVGLIGGGVYARILSEALPRYEVKPEFIVLDEVYIKNTASELYGLPVITPDECSRRYCDAYLIVAYRYKYENEWSIIRNETFKFTLETEVITLGTYFLNELDWLPYEYIIGSIDAFEQTYNMLDDALSRRIMVEYLNAKISGDARKLIMFNTDSKNDYELSVIKENCHDGVIIECGAFDGTSALEIDDCFAGERKIFALEPVSDTFAKLCKNTQGRKMIIPAKKGTSDKSGTAYINGGDSTASVEFGNDRLGEKIDIITLDESFENETAAVIVMDIEGSELSTLKGAQKIIKRDHPLLAVRVYHKWDDLITIPQFIASLGGDVPYRFFLRVNNSFIGTYDITLYAI